MDWIIEALPALAVAVTFAAVLWWLANRSPADDRDKASLIRLAEGYPEAEIVVRKVIARRRLQRRHVEDAARRVRAIVDLKKSQDTVSQFEAGAYRYAPPDINIGSNAALVDFPRQHGSGA